MHHPLSAFLTLHTSHTIFFLYHSSEYNFNIISQPTLKRSSCLFKTQVTSSSKSMAKTKNLCIFGLRLLALCAMAVAAIVMVTSQESTTVFNLSFKAKYSDAPSFKYFVIVNVIGGIYSLLVLFVPQDSLLGRVAVGLDVIVTLLLTSGISAALAVAYVGKKGNSHAGWLPICGQFSKLCDHVSGALICGFIAAVIYLGLVLHSIHTVVRSLFD